MLNALHAKHLPECCATRPHPSSHCVSICSYALAHRIISSWLHERQQGRPDPAGEGPGAALAAVPDVLIDTGSFKYVLLRLSTPDGETPSSLQSAGQHTAQRVSCLLQS